jgi:RHS repeat-associated protein
MHGFVKTEPVTGQLLINSADWDSDNLTFCYATMDVVNGYQLHRNTGFTYSEAPNKPVTLARGANNKLFVSHSGAADLYLLGDNQLLPTTTGLAGYGFTGILPQQSHFVQDKNPVEINLYTRALGNKRYELTDHLGNVRATVSDRLKLNGASYQADLQSTATYYPFGMTIGGLSYGSKGYRFGFQGQEKDDEVYGAGNLYYAQFWQYDARLGRRWNIDPKSITSESPYVAFRNNPIKNVDPDGNWPFPSDKKLLEVFNKFYNAVEDDFRDEGYKSFYSDINLAGNKGSAENKNTTVGKVAQYRDKGYDEFYGTVKISFSNDKAIEVKVTFLQNNQGNNEIKRTENMTEQVAPSTNESGYVWFMRGKNERLVGYFTFKSKEDAGLYINHMNKYKQKGYKEGAVSYDKTYETGGYYEKWYDNIREPEEEKTIDISKVEAKTKEE